MSNKEDFMIENKTLGTSYFLKSTKMADVLHANYHLLTVLNRFDIKLGFGDKTIEKVCTDYRLNIDFVLLILNTFHDPNYIRQHKIDVDTELLIKYLLQTHNYYTKAILPALTHMLKEVLVKTEDSAKAALLQRFFKKYISEFNEHVEYEETIAFPYVIMLSKVFKKEVHKREMDDILYRISDFVQNHTNVEDKLFDLKNILIKYYSMPDDESIIHILFLLFRFENDLRDHALLENELLVSLVQQMENQVF